MLIAYFKDKLITKLWDKQLRYNANRQKTKKAMTPLLARSQKAEPPRNKPQIEVAQLKEFVIEIP